MTEKDDRTLWECQEFVQWSNHRDWSREYLNEFAKNVPISRLQDIIDDRFEKLGKKLDIRDENDPQACYDDLASFFE